MILSFSFSGAAPYNDKNLVAQVDFFSTTLKAEKLKQSRGPKSATESLAEKILPCTQKEDEEKKENDARDILNRIKQKNDDTESDAGITKFQDFSDDDSRAQ